MARQSDSAKLLRLQN